MEIAQHIAAIGQEAKLLAEAAEDSFFQVLSDYFRQHHIEDVADRISIAEQYYAAVGVGKMEVKCAGPESGEVELVYSHVDQGWIKKWGNHTKPINFITWGYIAALFAAVTLAVGLLVTVSRVP